MDEHGTFLSPKDLPDNVRKIVQGVKIKESIVESEGGQNTVLNRWMEYELPNRQKARIELGKRVGFYPAEKTDHNLNLNVAIAGDMNVLALISAIKKDQER